MKQHITRHLTAIWNTPGTKYRLIGVGAVTTVAAALLIWAHVAGRQFGTTLTCAGHDLAAGQPAAIAITVAVGLCLLYLVVPMHRFRPGEEGGK